MEETIDLMQITDLQQLENMKSQQHNYIASAEAVIVNAKQNIQTLEARILQVKTTGEVVAGMGHMSTVSLDITPKSTIS